MLAFEKKMREIAHFERVKREAYSQYTKVKPCALHAQLVKLNDKIYAEMRTNLDNCFLSLYNGTLWLDHLSHNWAASPNKRSVSLFYQMISMLIS